MCTCFCGCTNTLWEQPRSTVFYLRSTVFTGLSCLLVGAHVHYLLSCQVYISGSVLPKGKTFCPTVWQPSQLLASLGGCQLKWHEWLNLWTACYLSCDPSHQVWLWEIRRAMICSHTRRVSMLEWDGFMDLASHRLHTHAMVLGQSVCYTLWVLALCTDWAAAIHIRGHALYHSHT